VSNGPTLEIDPEVFAAAPLARAATPDPHSLPGSYGQAPSTPALESLEANTRNHILAALEQSGWVIDGPRGAAKTLKLHPNTLRSRMKRLGIVRAPS
jgi:formate hydrogenlyase transcriptional activator